MNQVLKAAGYTLAIVVVCFVGALLGKACADATLEVTPVLEATTPESTGPAEREEETVVELPDTSGVKPAEKKS